MSKNNKKMDDVSSSNINITEIKKQAYNIIKSTEYEEFCEKYMGQNFSSLKEEELKKIYQSGIGLLNQHYITNDTVKSDIIIHLQYIINNVSYEIWNKQANSITTENKSLNKDLGKAIQKVDELEKDAEINKEEIKKMKDDMKSVITAIISIILAISIIPTAITGIEKIDANYILPFLSSIVLFGMIMVVFTYSIYQDKIKKSTGAILIIGLILSIVFWIISFALDIKNVSENDDLNNTQQIINETINLNNG